MNAMLRIFKAAPVKAGFICLLVALWVVGCKLSSDGSSDGHFSGLYRGADGKAFLSPANSGALVSELQFVQSDDYFRAVDNNGGKYVGSITQVSDTEAVFSLEGTTKEGTPVNIDGRIIRSGNSGSLSGTWKEPSRNCTLAGVLIIEVTESGDVIVPVTIQSPVTEIYTSSTQSYTATGGSGEYTWWADNNAFGSIAVKDSRQNEIQYVTGTNVGTVVLSVRDYKNSNNSDFVRVTIVAPEPEEEVEPPPTPGS